MDRICLGCPTNIDHLRTGAQVCSDKCRKRVANHSAKIVQIRLNAPQTIPASELPTQGDQSAPEKPAPKYSPTSRSDGMTLMDQTFKKLSDGKLLETYEGQLAMTLAKRIQHSSTDSGSSVASLSKELRQLMADLMTRAVEAKDPIDELLLRRERRNNSA